MTLSPKLATLLRKELLAGNVVQGEYLDEFGNCRVLVILKDPFRVHHPIPGGAEEFVNRDSHFPLGQGYKDNENSEILMAPFRVNSG